MLIKNLPVGTKLMWDAPPNEFIDANKRIIYPAIVTEQHTHNPWVKIRTGTTQNWMGPEQEYLRLPTVEELETLTWPSL